MNEEEKYFDYNMEPGILNDEASYINSGEPLISIITAYYNCKDYILQTATSVLNQTFPYWEWIIVNDGSTEPETEEILGNLEKQDSRIKVYHQENQGRLVARDLAISYTKSDIIFMLDSDDLLDKTLLECGYWTLYTNPKATWAYTNCVNFGDIRFLYGPDFNSNQEKKENLVIGSSFIRKKELLEVGGYNVVDKDVHEDWHLWLRLLEKNYFPIKMNFYGFWYRKRSGSTLNTISNDKAKEKHAKKIIKMQARKITNCINPIQYPVSSGNAYDSYPETFIWDKLPICDKKKQNILFILPWFIFGGADKFNYDLISKLDHNKYNITIITTEPSKYIWRQKFEKHATIFDLSTFLHRKNWSSFIHYIIKSRNIDLVMVSNCYYGYYVIPWLKSEFPEVIFTDYIHAHDWSWRNGAYTRDSIAIYNFIDKTYTCNNYVKNVMISDMHRNSNNIETVYIGVDTNDFNNETIVDTKFSKLLNKINDRKVILYICRIVELKRPIFVLHVLKKILEKDKSFILLVVGDGEQLSEMKEIARIFKLLDNIIFCGMQTIINPFYSIANITLICSLTEGLALTSYESLAMSVPVVTSDVGGQNELIDDSCGKVIPAFQDIEDGLFNRNYSLDEINLYVNSIIKIVNSKNYEQIRNNCREKITSNFSVNNMIEHIDNSFTNLIKNGTKTDLAILKNKELFKQYLVLYNDIDSRTYNISNGGIVCKKSIKKFSNIKDRLWENVLYRCLFKFLKKIGFISYLKRKRIG